MCISIQKHLYNIKLIVDKIEVEVSQVILHGRGGSVVGFGALPPFRRVTPTQYQCYSQGQL